MKWFVGLLVVFFYYCPSNANSDFADIIQGFQDKCTSYGLRPDTQGYKNCLIDLAKSAIEQEKRNVIKRCYDNMHVYVIQSRFDCLSAQCDHERRARAKVRDCINAELGIIDRTHDDKQTCTIEGNRVICDRE